MRDNRLPRSVSIFSTVALLFLLPQTALEAAAGEGFFQKFGDGWKRYVPRPQSGQELLPPCWGQPQNCRDANMPGDTPKLPSQYHASTSEQAVCVCVMGGSALQAWFTHKPASYGAIGASITVRAGACDSFIRCEQGSYRSYSRTVNATGWTSTTNITNNNTIYIMSAQ
jgi:hypothetical protein